MYRYRANNIILYTQAPYNNDNNNNIIIIIL